MSSGAHYTSSLRDLEFNLFEYLDIGKNSLGRAPFDTMEEGDAKEVLRTFSALATEQFAPSFAAIDKDPPRRTEQGDVILPEAVKSALALFNEGEWRRLTLPPEMDGMGAPNTVAWAQYELLAGANAAVSFYTLNAFIARTIHRLGTQGQKDRYLPHFIDRDWGAAMVLTEPDAGSDVGAARTKAWHVEDDIWQIEGVKRFITNGEYDAVENNVHLVLARPEGAAAGTKGLSMFIVPKYWVEKDGSLGPRNGTRCIGLEDKMGIKGSVTCEMAYGTDDEPCRGLLVGNEHDGIRQMFHVIEHARMAVGVKSLAELHAGYAGALAYAKERVQGPKLENARDRSAPKVTIINHPDVRRMLMSQKAHSEGMRAMALYAASVQDEVSCLGGHEAPEAAPLVRLNDLLLPLIKGYGSEKAYELLSLSLQCLGGSGYVKDHPVEQYIRDQKIDSLYEGTTHIQALDLLFRKVGRDGGQTLGALMANMQKTLKAEAGGDVLAGARANLARAVGDVGAMFQAMLGKLGENINHAGFQANRMLMALAELTIGWLLIEHAALAAQKLSAASGRERHFYAGKVAAAQWFAHEVLPSLTLARKQVENSSVALMTLDEEAF